MHFSPKMFTPVLVVFGGLLSSCSTNPAQQASTMTTPQAPPASTSQTSNTSNFYVSTKGSDNSGDGSTTLPWATIAYASSRAQPGTTIHVAAGIYNGSFSTSASGTSSAYLTYVADSVDFSTPVNCAQVAANHGNLSTCVRLVGSYGTTWTNSGDYVVIEGFDVTGPGLNGIYTQGNATQITGNHVHDVLTSSCNSDGGSGINLNGKNAEVIGNYVHNIGPFPSACGYVQGIYFLTARGLAWNNISFANSGFGIQLWHEPSNISLINNTIFNNATGGIVLGTDDSNFTVDYITVRNNIVFHNAGWGIQEQGASSSSTGIHNVYTNNLVDQNASGSLSLQNGLTALISVTGNPQFVDYTGTSTGDYQLLADSPAINAGTSTGAPTHDFNNVSRPEGSDDIGAYQYSSAGAAGSPASSTVSLNPAALIFTNITAGSTSTVQFATLSNASKSTLTFDRNFAISGPFAFGGLGTCGSTVPVGGSCTISVVFKPSAAGMQTGTVTITDSSGTQTLQLSGTAI